jgi:predicted ATP-binding protein involved in virulence
MQIIETTFNNFRCFKRYTIKYGIQTTVFIGKNGTGKSSILSGLRRGLSFMFAKPKTFQKNLAISNNAKVKSFGSLEANFDSISRSYNYPIENSFRGIFVDKEIDWSLYKKAMSGGLTTTRYSKALNEVLNNYNINLQSELPLLAVFSDSFPHEKINFGTKVKKIINQEILPRDFGYYAWDERTNCIELWLARFYKVATYSKDLKNEIKEVEEQIFFYQKRIDWKDEHDENQVPKWEEKIEELERKLKELNSKIELLKNDKRNLVFSKERAFIENKLIEFTKPISEKHSTVNKEFELYRLAVNKPDKKNNTLEFSFKDERSISFETLPMGYKRVFSIVIDLAYRSYILNEGIESSGIVLIDEVELHLHPTLQQEILQRLRKTFPNIQFIVTTHSALVISNLKANEKNKIIKLEHEGNKYWNTDVDNIYGIDYITSLMEVMDAKYRPSTIDKLIDLYVALKARNKENEAKITYEKLKEYFDGEPNQFILDEIKTKLNSYQ